MHLSSSIEPNGPKSTGHYIILHHQGQRNLIKLPESYPDLQKVVQKLYNLKPDEFYVETKELNLCAGESVRIPEGLWSDLALLLGNVYVVLSALGRGDRPEAFPQVEWHPTSENATNGVLNFNTPLVNSELLVITLGKIDLLSDLSSTTKLSLRILDERDQNALSITFFPRTGSAFLSTSTTDTIVTRPLEDLFPLSGKHNIIVFKQETSFNVLFDMQLVGSVNSPAHSALTSLSYDLGAKESQSPFKGPLSASVYTGLEQLREQFLPYRSLFPPVDKETLYKQVLICDPRNSAHVLGALASVRGETTMFKNSTSGIKYRSRDLPDRCWTPFDWDFRRYSIFGIRFRLPEVSSASPMIVRFGKTSEYALKVEMKLNNAVVFGEHEGGKLVEYHTIKLTDSMFQPGDHLIAFLVQGGKIHIVFDTKRSVVLPKATLVTRKPKEVYVTFHPGAIAVADIYEFGGI